MAEPPARFRLFDRVVTPDPGSISAGGHTGVDNNWLQCVDIDGDFLIDAFNDVDCGPAFYDGGGGGSDGSGSDRKKRSIEDGLARHRTKRSSTGQSSLSGSDSCSTSSDSSSGNQAASTDGSKSGDGSMSGKVACTGTKALNFTLCPACHVCTSSFLGVTENAEPCCDNDDSLYADQTEPEWVSCAAHVRGYFPFYQESHDLHWWGA